MIRLIIILPTILLVILVSVLEANTIHVPADSATIQAGINGAVDGDTILVADGTYTGDGNRDIRFYGKAIVVMSENGPESCVIDCEGDALNPHRGFFFNDGEDSTSLLQGFTVTNGYSSYGGGIHCVDSPIIKNCIIHGNKALYGGGIAIDKWPTIVNCDITRNSNYAIMLDHLGSPRFINCIFWDNDPCTYGPIGSPQFYYCDVEGGVGWGVGNIDTDPMFRNPEESDFHLMSTECGDPFDSPCIDTGHPDSIDVVIDCDHGLGTVLCDMGAYGGNNAAWPVGIEKEYCSGNHIPKAFLLNQNYPNPFNPMTTITFTVPDNASVPQSVRLTVYDLRGRLIKTLLDSELESGIHRVIWDGKDNRGEQVSSGVYLYTLKCGDKNYTRKMVVVE